VKRQNKTIRTRLGAYQSGREQNIEAPETGSWGEERRSGTKGELSSQPISWLGILVCRESATGRRCGGKASGTVQSPRREPMLPPLCFRPGAAPRWASLSIRCNRGESLATRCTTLELYSRSNVHEPLLSPLRQCRQTGECGFQGRHRAVQPTSLRPAHCPPGFTVINPLLTK